MYVTRVETLEKHSCVACAGIPTTFAYTSLASNIDSNLDLAINWILSVDSGESGAWDTPASSSISSPHLLTHVPSEADSKTGNGKCGRTDI